MSDAEIVDLFTKNEITLSAQNIIRKEVIPDIDKIDQDIDKIKYKIHTHRFWLGKKLFPIHMQQLESLEEVAKHLRDDIYKHHRIGSLTDAFQSGRKRRLSELDITDVIKLL